MQLKFVSKKTYRDKKEALRQALHSLNFDLDHGRLWLLVFMEVRTWSSSGIENPHLVVTQRETDLATCLTLNNTHVF